VRSGYEARSTVQKRLPSSAIRICRELAVK
jgi:hypothetical protein